MELSVQSKENSTKKNLYWIVFGDQTVSETDFAIVH